MPSSKAIHSSLATLVVALWGAASTAVYASPVPVYAYAEAYVSEGLSPPEEGGEHGPGPVHGEAGDYCWFHAGSGGCPGSVVANPGGVAAWGEVFADAGSGSSSLTVEAFNYGVPDRSPPLPPHNHWGVANGYAYLRSTWEVSATDPSLQVGDPVELEFSFLLDGVFDIGSATDPGRGYSEAGVAFMLNHLADAVWLDEDFYLDEYRYLNRGSFDDIQADLGGLAIESQRYSLTNVDGPVSLADARTILVHVGDVVTLETAIRTDLLIWNTNAAGLNDIFYMEGDFANTFSQSLQATTLGAQLTLVPEPTTALLLGCGLLGLAMKRRRTA